VAGDILMIAFSRDLIFACFAIFILFWIATAFSTKRTVERAKIPVAAALLLLPFIAIEMWFFGPRLMGSGATLWNPTPISAAIADVLALAGLAIMLWARVTLGRNWSGGVVLKEDHELIQRGPYAYVRHPIYSGVFLLMLGFAVLKGRLSTFGVVFMVIVLLWLKATQEEKLLISHFPTEYPAYRKRVKALIPFIL
jgi:protein-S-isoprenylcysteine O-methyltransferase Ste14